MGRGLSDLQKTILRLALAKWEKAGSPTKGIEALYTSVTRDEILRVHYGWAHAIEYYWGKPHQTYAFSPAEIGVAKYNAAQTAVTRALKRLLARHLLGGPTKRSLTKEGWAIATQLRELSVEFEGHGLQTQPLDITDKFDRHDDQTQPLSAKEMEDIVNEARSRRQQSPQPKWKEIKAKKYEEQRLRNNLWQRDYARRRRSKG